MAVSAVITPGKIFTDGEAITVSELNKLGAPTVDISGAVGSLSLADGSVTNAKVAAGTGVQLDKLETGTDAQVIVANSSGEGVWVAVSGDATVDNLGAVTIAAGAVEASMLAANAAMPAGAITQYGGTSAPTGWLFCDGSLKDSDTDTSLAALYIAIGFTYGGTGSDAFNLPDLRGRIPMGTNDAGLPNGLLTSDTARPTERNEGATGGTETHLLTGAESGTSAHAHYLDFSGRASYDHAGTGQFTAGGSSGSETVPSFNSDDSTAADAASAHANIQPFVVVNFIIKT